MPWSKTYSPADLHDPSVTPARRALSRFALRLGLRGTPFAVNGILRRRFWVRQNKLWEYARGVAFIAQFLANQPRKEGAPARVLDFGGAATLPVFYLADLKCDVLCLDIDSALSDWTNSLAGKCGWKLQASTHNLVTSPAPAEWGSFDAVISFSVLEHIPKAHQAPLLSRLAELLKPGGVFALSFDFGVEAPVEGAVRNPAEVERLVAATGLDYFDGRAFVDTGERFVIDQRHPSRRFTFGSVFLRKKE